MTDSSHRNIIVLILILAMGFLLRVPFLSVPPDRDEGGYAAVTQVIIEGGIPYKDAESSRPPGIHYIYAFFFKAFGERVEAIRIGSAIFAGLTSLFIFKLATQLYGEKTGLLAAFLYMLFSSGPLIQGSFGNCEAFMMLPATVATYFFFLGYKYRTNRCLLIAGIFSGLAYLVKESTLPNFLLFYIFFIIACRSAGVKEIAKGYLYLSIGFAVSISVVFIYLASKGALSDYITTAYIWNKGYGQFNLDHFWRRMVDRGVYLLGKEYSFLWLASTIAVLTTIRERTLDNSYIPLWILFSFLGVCLGSMFWPHYFIQMIPALSIGAAYGLKTIYSGIKDRGFVVKGLSYVTASVLVISLSYAAKTDYRYYLVYTPEEISKAIYGDLFVTSMKVAEYVKERTLPSDYIYQSRWEPEVYFTAQRRNPSRFLSHLFVNASPDPIKSIGELRDALLYKQPKYIVWFNPRPGEVSEFVVKPIIDVKYELETEIGGVKIFRLKGWKGIQ